MADQVTGAIKYSDSPTVYGNVGGTQYAFSSGNDFTGLGGDFKNVQNLAQPTPDILKSAPIYKPNAIGSTQLAPTTPITVPAPVAPTGNPDGTVAAAAATPKTLQDYLAMVTPPKTATDTQASSLQDSITSLLGQDSNKGTDQLSAEQAAGIPQLQSQISDINGQIATKTADYNAAFQSLEQNPQQIASVVGSKQQELQRTQAADIGLLQARGQALQGNLAAAQNTVNRSIDLKYSTIEAKINTQLQQLSSVKDQLNTEQSRYADAYKLYLQDQQQQIQDKKDTEKQVQTIALQAAQNGATQGAIAAITNAKDINTATQLATPYLAKAQTQVVEVNGHSLLIDSQTGKTLQDLGTSNSIIQANIAHAGTGSGSSPTSIVDPNTDAGVKAIIASKPGDGGYGDAYNAVAAKYGTQVAQKYDKIYQAVFNNGQDVNSAFGGASVPSIVSPYLSTASNGVQYVDASTLQGTAAQKTAIIQAATKAGLKVITNKNTAADLVNIADAKSKLSTIGNIFSTISQPDALSRNLYGLGLTKFATMAQTNTQQAAAGALSSVGLDILKAISGVQGFRGNQAAIQQVTEHLPTIYDTQAVVQQKIDYINQLISDRENAALGTSGPSNPSSSSSNDPLGLGI